MYHFDEISEWLDDALEDISNTGIPDEVIAFGFNLYDDDGGVGFVDGNVEILYNRSTL